MVDNILKDATSQTFLGVRIAQYWSDLLLWEKFFNEELHPYTTIIELGTGNGAMSMYLNIQARSRGMVFASYDVRVSTISQVSRLPSQLGFDAIVGNVFDDKTVDFVKKLIDKHGETPFVIFGDNGNKPMEWKVYGPLLRPGDFFVVHDWNTEFKAEDIPEAGRKIEFVMEELCEETDSLTRWMRILE